MTSGADLAANYNDLRNVQTHLTYGLANKYLGTSKRAAL